MSAETTTAITTTTDLDLSGLSLAMRKALAAASRDTSGAFFLNWECRVGTAVALIRRGFAEPGYANYLTESGERVRAAILADSQAIQEAVAPSRYPDAEDRGVGAYAYTYGLLAQKVRNYLDASRITGKAASDMEAALAYCEATLAASGFGK